MPPNIFVLEIELLLNAKIKFNPKKTLQDKTTTSTYWIEKKRDFHH